MDNSIDRLLSVAAAKNSRVIYRLSPGLHMFRDEGDDPSKTRMTMLADYCKNSLVSLAETAAGVMFDYAAFASTGVEGLITLSMLLSMAKYLGLYTLIDGCFSGSGALRMCEGCFYAEAGGSSLAFPADALTISPYIPEEDMKAIARICREEDKAVFVCAKNKAETGKESFENIKTESGLKLYEAAVDDAGAFGESFVGEKGYSVIGFITAPVENSRAMRDLDRWGIALVRATPEDLDKANTFDFFYPREWEGEFVVLTDRETAAFLGMDNEGFDREKVFDFFAEAVKKTEEKRKK